MINDLYHNKYFKYIQQSEQPKQNNEVSSYQMLKSISIGDISLTNYVFFDKTGTITDGQNMDIKMLIIDGKIYNIDTNQA